MEDGAAAVEVFAKTNINFLETHFTSRENTSYAVDIVFNERSKNNAKCDYQRLKKIDFYYVLEKETFENDPLLYFCSKTDLLLINRDVFRTFCCQAFIM